MPKTVAIIGAGLAGAACASAFAHAGFSVSVYEQGSKPAAGASGVPLAMFAPSVSADDAPYSRLLRRGVHLLLAELNRLTVDGLLLAGVDWAHTGVLERCVRGDKKLPAVWREPQDPPALQSRVLTKLDLDQPTMLFHGAAGWVNPSRLIDAWLAHANITSFQNAQIAKLDDVRLQACDVLVVAGGYETPDLLMDLKTVIQPIRGQVEWGVASGSINPINGMGHWIEGAGKWLTGATFQRDESDLATRAKDVDLNFKKLATLRPEIKQPRFVRLRETSTSWVGVRAVQKNRMPLIERIEGTAHPQAWVCTGLGSRGLSLAALCASNLLPSVQNHLALV